MEQAALPEARLEPIPLGSREAPVLLIPNGVALGLVWLAASGGISALLCLLSFAMTPDYDGAPPPPHWVEWLRSAGYAWIALVCSGALLAHVKRGPRVWAITFAFLFAQSAALLTSLVSSVVSLFAEPQGLSTLLAGLGWCFAPFYALPHLAGMAVMVFYFQSAGWYGVTPRRRWRTLWFSGGWMLLLTALLFGANQIAQYRYLH